MFFFFFSYIILFSLLLLSTFGCFMSFTHFLSFFPPYFHLFYLCMSFTSLFPVLQLTFLHLFLQFSYLHSSYISYPRIFTPISPLLIFPSFLFPFFHSLPSLIARVPFSSSLWLSYESHFCSSIRPLGVLYFFYSGGVQFAILPVIISEY